jgi:hypothetical protein
MDRLDEALTIIRAMFTETRPSFDGRCYRIERALNEPRPIQADGPRILVGGGGEQRTLKIAARHADMTHWFQLGLEGLRRKTEVLERHCEAIGRDPAAIERTMATPVLVAPTEAEARGFIDDLIPERRPHVVAGTPDQMADAIRPTSTPDSRDLRSTTPSTGHRKRLVPLASSCAWSAADHQSTRAATTRQLDPSAQRTVATRIGVLTPLIGTSRGSTANTSSTVDSVSAVARISPPPARAATREATLTPIPL